MESFLLWIGIYNLLGAIAVVGCFSESFGDRVLRRWLQIITQPYHHGAYGPLWVFWAASTNVFLGLVMILATRWPPAVQREVTIGVIVVYVLGLIAGVLAARTPRYQPKGVYATLVLWVAQIAWCWRERRGYSTGISARSSPPGYQ